MQENALSVWYVEDDGSNLERVVTALAATREHVSHFDYLLFDYAVVTDLGLTIKKTTGGTFDNAANRSWHRDLTELSGRRVLALLTTIFYASDVKRIPQGKILEWVKAAIANSEIDSSRLSPKLAAKALTTPMSPVPRFLRMCTQVHSAITDAWQEFRRG